MNDSKPPILIADDDEILREFNEYRLTGHGYQVHCARDKREALRVVEAE